MYSSKRSKELLLVIVLLFIQAFSYAQSLLNRTIPLEVNHQRLDNVLEILSNKGNFYFSYNSNIIKKDSLVTLSASNKTVKQILDMLFPDHYEFMESGNYIIIRKTPIKITLVTNKAVTEDKFYVVSGYVLDDETAQQIPYASIYEKRMLISALTNTQGFFRIRLKHKSGKAILTVSKQFYHDTDVAIDPGYNQQITVTITPLSTGAMTIISPDDYFAPDQLKLRVQKDSSITEYTYVKADSSKVERTAMGNFLLSAAQKFQSLNLRRFFIARPFQLSLTPGLSTHGRLSGQVINNFSFNVFGGYNGGANGLEVGGLFNIDKMDVQYVQVGGLFNLVGGQMTGLQIGGISNTVLDTSTGLQIGGINNLVKGKFDGLQVGGIYNHVTESVRGGQLAGIANFARKKISGVQVAGIANVSNREMGGVQIGGIFNYAKKLRGLQIALINIADTSDGYSIGLINVVFKGYHKLSLFTDEITNSNAAFKTGNSKLYSILQAGMNLKDNEKLYTFGYGIGSEWLLSKTFSLNPELTAQHLYLGSWDYANILSKAHLNLNIKLGKYVSLFGGPSFAVYYSNQSATYSGYKSAIPPSGYHTYDLGHNLTGWLGWTAGINFF